MTTELLVDSYRILNRIIHTYPCRNKKAEQKHNVECRLLTHWSIIARYSLVYAKGKGHYR